MIKKNFCLVGVEFDFEDLIIDYSGYYLGFFTSRKNKNYNNKFKKLGKENLKDWLTMKKKFNPDVYITVDDGRERESLYKDISGVGE